jgi:hypothetical protein
MAYRSSVGVREMKTVVRAIGWIALLCGLFYGAYYIDHGIWRAEHPDAPEWTFWMGNH